MTFLNRDPAPAPTPDSETEAILNDPDALAAIAEAEGESDEQYQTERVLTFSSTNDDHTWFKQRVEGNRIRSLIAIDRETYDDMGAPATVTVTVRPGDHLNTDDDD